MEAPFYTGQQWQFFCNDLLRAYLRAGFEVVDEPYIDYALCGFRATYVRRYIFHKPSLISDGILTTFVQVAGIPFGCHSNKMVILSTPRDANNEPHQIQQETVKLRVHFELDGQCRVIHGDHSKPPTAAAAKEQQTGQQNNAMLSDDSPPSSQNSSTSSTTSSNENQSNQQPIMLTNMHQHEYLWLNSDTNHRLDRLQYDLAKYLARIIELISPGLIELPLEMKLEILKKLNIDSIMKMAQVNNEFRAIIFEHGETLWRHLCYRDFKIRSINRFVYRSWMELYRDSYVLHQIEICRKERALPGLPERPALPAAPNLLQIEWFPAVMELPFYPLDAGVDHHHLDDHEPVALAEEHLQLALQLPVALPLRRADSLDSLHHHQP